MNVAPEGAGEWSLLFRSVLLFDGDPSDRIVLVLLLAADVAPTVLHLDLALGPHLLDHISPPTQATARSDVAVVQALLGALQRPHLELAVVVAAAHAVLGRTRDGTFRGARLGPAAWHNGQKDSPRLFLINRHIVLSGCISVIADIDIVVTQNVLARFIFKKF